MSLGVRVWATARAALFENVGLKLISLVCALSIYAFIHGAERVLVRAPVEHLAGEHDHPGAGAERGQALGQPLPQRRPPCFFDPRHGMSVADVPWTPPGGASRDVPACALDVERVRAGAEPDIRKVMVGNRRVPYFQGGRAYQPYAAGYFGGFGPMDMMFMGMLFGGGFDGMGDGIGAIGEGLGEGIGSIGDGIGGMFDGIGGMFDGFDGFDF